MIRFYRSRSGAEFAAVDHASRFAFDHEGRTVVNFSRCRIATNAGTGRPSAVQTVVASEGVLSGLVEVEPSEVPDEWMSWLAFERTAAAPLETSQIKQGFAAMPKFNVPVEAFAALVCAAKEQSRFHMQLVRLKRSGKQCTLSATDGKMMSEYEWADEGEEGELLAPAVFLRDAEKLAKKLRAGLIFVEAVDDGDKLRATTGGPARGWQSIETRREDGRFPPIDSVRIRPKDRHLKITLAADVLKRLAAIADSSDGGNIALYFDSHVKIDGLDKCNLYTGVAFQAGGQLGVAMPVTQDISTHVQTSFKLPSKHDGKAIADVPADEPTAEPTVVNGPAPAVAGDRPAKPATPTTENTSKPVRARQCNACSSEGPIHGKGLCKRCYRNSRKAATPVAQTAAAV